MIRGLRQLAALIAAGLLIGGCSGGGGDGSASASEPPGNPNGTPSAAVTVSGTVTFDYVPAVPGIGLDYPRTEERPARGVSVELIAGTAAVASTVTDAAGRYSLTVPANTDAKLRVSALLAQTGPPSWDFRVLDNTSDDALYVLEGSSFNTGSADSVRDLHAPSGWGGSSYTGPRAAAPFAILDVIYDAVQLVLAAAPEVEFPPLAIHWSPANVPSFGSDGAPDIDSGQIGSSFFVPSLGIYLLGAENQDTDEYDRHVIAHEWGHYFEHSFSRSDSIGGPHTRGDHLDMRVAFGEGFGNALSAMITGDSIYRDVVGPRQSRGFGFDVEGPHPLPGNGNPSPGWFSEESIQELLYDLFDDAVDLTGPPPGVADDVALGFEPIYAVLTGAQRTTTALTSVFPFVNALRTLRPELEPQIQALVAAQAMDPIVDDYGANQTNFGEPATPDLRAVYERIDVNGPPVEVCSLDQFTSGATQLVNKLGSRRYLAFDAPAPGNYTFEAVATDVPAGDGGEVVYADPDMVLHRAGVIARSEGAPSGACQGGDTAQCVERFSRPLAAGPHVLEVYEWTNTTQDPNYPPIGRTCFAVRITL